MAKTDFRSVDEYIASQPENAQEILRQVRNTIREALPEAEEVISYKIPTYKLGGAAVLYFAGWKQHYSLYPASDALKTALKTDLDGYETEKGTIRFPLSEPVPVELIRAIARFRAREILGRTGAKELSPRKARTRRAG